jgi:lysyl oxidase
LAPFLALLLAPGVAAASSLLPDLKPLASGAARLCQEDPTTEDACTGTGRTVLRTTTKAGNSGKGPLELAAVPAAQQNPGDCPPATPPETGDGVLVKQRVYHDRNGDGVFERSIDGSWTSHIVGCRYYHPAHHHYHFEDFVRFGLVEAQTGTLVRGGDKISFCINDSGSFNLSLPGAQQPSSSGGGFYGSARCAVRNSIQGVSIGWDDTYTWKTPGQEIDVTGLPAGDYCVVTQTDPDNHLAESNKRNNVRRVRYHIDPAEAPVNSSLALRQVPGGCPS